MDEATKPKPWWASKTILSQVVIVLLAAGFAGYSYWKHGDAAAAAATFTTFTGLAGAGIYGRVSATQPIGKPEGGGQARV